jgi:hypothetical protein
LLLSQNYAIISIESEERAMNIYSIKIFEVHKKNGTQVIANSPKEALEQVKRIKGIPKDKLVLWKWKKIF